MKFHLVKTHHGFVPADSDDSDKVRKLGDGEIIECKVIDQRILGHHRKFFALIKLAHGNLPERFDGHFPTTDDLRYELIRRAGFYRSFTDMKGVVQYVPESIAFDKMSQERFEQLYDRVLDLVCQLRAVEKPEIMEILSEF